MTAVVSSETLHFIANEEGCRLKAYQDSRGIWTIGYGQTMIRGRAVRKGDTITQAEADAGLRMTAQYVQNHVLAMIRPEIRAKLKPQQISALVSLAYNIGLDEDEDTVAEGFGDSTLLKLLNGGHFSMVADEFPKWSRAGNNKTLLLARRKRERSLFLS